MPNSGSWLYKFKSSPLSSFHLLCYIFIIAVALTSLLAYFPKFYFPADYEPLAVQNVSVLKYRVEEENPYQLQVEIGFEPAKGNRD